MKADRGLTIERRAELGRVSRSSCYRLAEDTEQQHKVDRDMDLRHAIQRITLEWSCYGRPLITRELRRRGWTVNPKRVYRTLREDNLLCVRKRKFVVTTESNPRTENLSQPGSRNGGDRYRPTVADITCIRLQDEFVFLAVILDACSRRVIGWALERTLEDDLTLSALRLALDY